MSWFNATAEQFGKTPAPAGTLRDDGSGRVFPTSTPGYQPSGGSASIWNPNAPKLDPTTGEYRTPTNAGIQMSDPRAYFDSLFPGSTLTPQQLAAKEAELQAAGIRLLGPNAAGMRTKIELPGGQVIDVIGGAAAGHNRKQWGPTGGPSAGPASPGPMGTTGGSLGMLGGGSPNYAARQGALEDTPGFKFRMQQGLDAVQKSAAAKGTLLSGGTLKDLTEFAQGLASTEFGNEFGRNMNLADLGLRAAGAQGAYGTSYSNDLTNLTTGAGNAQAAGTAASGNAWGGALNNLGSLGMQAGLYNWLKPKPYSYDAGWE